MPLLVSCSTKGSVESAYYYCTKYRGTWAFCLATANCDVPGKRYHRTDLSKDPKRCNLQSTSTHTYLPCWGTTYLVSDINHPRGRSRVTHIEAGGRCTPLMCLSRPHRDRKARSRVPPQERFFAGGTVIIQVFHAPGCF